MLGKILPSICNHGCVKRYLAWPIALPLALIGTLAGHSLGYRAAVPDAHAREHVLAASGHAYLEYAPLAVGLCSAAVFLAFLATILGSFLGRERGSGAQAKLVAAVPPLAFVVQEVLERYLHEGHVHWQLLVSAPFVLGLLAQLPFALLAAAVAYALGRAAERLGVLLAARRPRPARCRVPGVFAASVDLPSRPVLARGYAGRGPPLAAS
jgi:hypothetical protein